MTSKAILQFIIFLLPAMFLSAGCGRQAADISEDSEPEIDWGREVTFDEMIAMAKEDRILEIQWHVLPNVLRAKASDGLFYHLKNENKGVDLRNALINSGVKIGEGGVRFQHVF